VQGQGGQVQRVITTVLGWLEFAAGCCVWGLVVIPMTLALARFHPRAVHRFRLLTSAALRLYFRSLRFVRIEVHRASPPLDGPHVLVANHQSYLDPLLLLSMEPRLRGPVRPYIGRVPVLREIMKLLGFIPAGDDSASYLRLKEEATRAASDRPVILFFPEGTRSRDGSLGTFQRGAFRLAAELGVPVQPVVIDGFDRVLPPGAVLCQTAGRPNVRIHYLAPVFPPRVFVADGGGGSARAVSRELLQQVRDAILGDLRRSRDRQVV
jgi:1-acyl-sn-glycerol-3-phosphate acyltransferase